MCATRYLLNICSWKNLFISVKDVVLMVSLIRRYWYFFLCVGKMSLWVVDWLVCSSYLQVYSLESCQVDAVSCTWWWQCPVSAGVICVTAVGTSGSGGIISVFINSFLILFVAVSEVELNCARFSLFWSSEDQPASSNY